MSLSETISSIADSASQHLPEILWGTSVATGVATTIYSVAITPKAIDRMYEHALAVIPESERAGLKMSELIGLLPFSTKFKLCWKYYILSAVGLAISIGTGTASLEMKNHESMAYAALASASQARLRDFTESTKEIVGDKKYDEIEARTSEKTLDRVKKENPKLDENTYYVNKKTEGYPVIDDITRRRYIVDIRELSDIQSRLNDRLPWEMWIPLNDFYRELDVPTSAVGEDLGWDVRDGKIRFFDDMRGALDDDHRPTGVLHLINNLSIRYGSAGSERIKIRG